MNALNPCSLLWDNLPGQEESIRTCRLLLANTLIIVFLLYVILKALAKCKGDSVSAALVKDQADFMLAFGDQAVAVGFAFAFSPYPFEVVLSVLIVATRIVTEAVKYRLLRQPSTPAEPHSMTQVPQSASNTHTYQLGVFTMEHERLQKFLKSGKTACRLLNMALLLCSLVGLSRMGFDMNRMRCKDSDYR